MIYLIRHAESESNAGGTITDLASIKLTKFGEEQAKVLANKLENFPEPIAIYTSPYDRTVNTAEYYINKHQHIPVHNISLAKEFVCLPPNKELTKLDRLKFMKNYWTRLNPEYTSHHDTESFNAFIERAQNFCNFMFKYRADDVVFVFTHEMFINAVVMLENNNLWEMKSVERMKYFYDHYFKVHNTGIITLQTHYRS